MSAGLFITGTDTDVGKTYIAAQLARYFIQQGKQVGVYKPVASGCREEEGELVSDDALTLWNAANRIGNLEDVCPQRFAAPLAPPLAAREAGTEVNEQLIEKGLRQWQTRTNFLLVEGAGGFLSPLSQHWLVADVARLAGYPLVIVAANRIGVVNQVLQTLHAAKTWFREPLPIAGVILNSCATADVSCRYNGEELRERGAPLLAEVAWNGLLNGLYSQISGW